MATKVDFKRTLDSYKAKAGEFRLVELPTLQYLMVDGQGDPNTSPAYQQALQTLYPVAYKLKFASKRELRMHSEFLPVNGLQLTGKHHEVYLSDFRKVVAQKLRTILQQPVLRAR